MALWLPEKFWRKPQNNQLAQKSAIFKMAEITMAPIFICVVKIQMPSTYILLKSKYYQD